ncbi:MAG: His-Xaa-Ser repeat protein HxsA3 [Bacilli bacterium]
MSDTLKIFPKFARSISDLIEDEEGNIPGNRLLLLGTMVIIIGNMIAMDALLGHGSHSSHSSHASHASGSTHGNSSGIPSSHGSHASHGSHSSHTSHSNTVAHSNSLYSSEGDVKYPAPTVSNVPGILVPTVSLPSSALVLPSVNQNIEIPAGTPPSTVVPFFRTPTTSPTTKIDVGEIKVPSTTEKVK